MLKKICYYVTMSLIMLVCITNNIVAAPAGVKVSLTGKVTDEIDGNPLIGVTITIPSLSVGTTTNIDGEYKIEDLPQKQLTLQVSYLGHQTIIKKVDLSKVKELNFVMKESNATLNEVVVTGLTGQSLMKDSPTPISVVTSNQLKETSSSNLIDAIAHQPGISQITTGGGISKPVIRGLGYNRIVTVNDGIRQEGQQWGDEHGIEIDAQSINNVEILKGPASLMYGSDAMAGVVIFHGDPVPANGQLKASAATEYQTNNGLFDYTLDFAGNKKGLVWNLRGSQKMAHAYKNKIDGYVAGSQMREAGLNGMLGLNRDWGYSHLNLSYYHLTPSMIEGEGEGSSTYAKALPFQQIHHYKAVWNNSLYIGDGILKAILGFQQNRRQEFEESAEEPGLDFRLNTLNYSLNYSLENANEWKINTGVGGMYQRSENLGDEYLIPSYALFDIGAFATTSKQFGKWNVSGGLRFDHRHLHSFALEDRFEKFSRSCNALSGSIGAVYDITPDMHFRLNLARGFRAPNLSELASNGEHEGTFRYELGDHQLKPEYSWQVDAGWDYSSSNVSFQIALFANYIDNYIFNSRLADVLTEELPTYQFTQGNARLLGGEASIDIHPVEALHFLNSFTYVNAQQMDQPAESKYLPMTPAPRWNSEIKYDIIRDGKTFNNLFVKLGLECNLKQDHYYAANETETETPSYTLLNLSAGTDILHKGRKWCSLYIIGDNLTNRAYQNHLSRLKYLGENESTGRMGVYNMGRNITFKVTIPIL